MSIEQKYENTYKSMNRVIKQRREARRYTALGLTSNLDLLCDFHIQKLNALLEQHHPELDGNQIEAHRQIHSLKEMLETIVFFCMKGIGGEVEFEDIHYMKEAFQWTLGMGGTGVQAALALDMLNSPSVVHLTDNSKEVCEILDRDSIFCVSQNGKLISTMEVEQDAPQEIHCIVQFQKGDKIHVGSTEIVIPESNRLIFTKMTVNTRVPFYEPYFHYIEKEAKHFSSIVISSFNEIEDERLFDEKIKYLQKHIHAYKANNAKGIVFFEDAHYHTYAIKEQCMKQLYSFMDIVSLNEEELIYTLQKCGIQKNVNRIIECIEGVQCLREKFCIQKGMIVHTKDYAMYVGDALDVDIEAGLIYGNLLATTKAICGWYGTYKQIGETMKLQLSAYGMQQRDIIRRSVYKENVILVPSKYIDKPKYTIGLGDSFVAGVQMCFE